MRFRGLMFIIGAAAVLFGGILKGAFAQAPLPGALELVRQSDFVGIVLASPEVSNPTREWRQSLFLYRIDPLKGNLMRDPAINNQYPWIFADPASASGYPAWLSQKGEYLVFLRHGLLRNGSNDWTTAAAFRIEYRPDANGRIVGVLPGDRQKRQGMSVARVRAILERLAAHKEVAHEDVRSLDTLFQKAASSGRSGAERKPVPYEVRLLEAQDLAASIPQGTTRAEIEKVFPQEDGGLSGSGSTRYYLGSEVMVEVPYDQTGGAWKPQNRVNGTIKVYHSPMHFD